MNLKHAQAVVIAEADAGQGAEVLGVQKQHGALAQALVFDGIQAVEDRQLRMDCSPGAIGNRVASQQAALAPGLERPHGARLVSHPVRGCSS